MYIGDIYLPILSNIDKKSVSKITKEIAGINAKEPRTVSIRRNLQPITLEGYLYNDGEKTDEQYAEDVEALQYRSAGYCYTQYADLDGFIEIEGADAPETSEELGVRNYSVEGKYLPASKYERIVEVETEMRDNEFNIEFPPHVALPVGATNVRVKTSQDSVKLSTPAFMAGDIPIYRPFPAFYPGDVTHSDSNTPQYDATAYKLTYNLLDAEDESISYTMVSGIDIPLGSYRVVLRIKEDSVVTGDVKITVSDGTTNVVDSLHTLVGDGVWNIVKTASFSILQKGLTYTITVTKAEADATSIAVNYGFLLPDKRARVAFDVAAEYDVGECKVYDTITTDAAEAGWIQVYNPEHDFAGDIVVQNSMFRWVIKQTAWKDATTVYNVSGTSPVEIGELYNKAFGDDSVAIKFKEIKPNYLKFTFELDTGNATSESTSAKEIDTVEITPFNVVIDKDVIGAYKDHYTFESTPDEMIEYENGVIAGIDSNSVYGLIKSVDVTSSYDGDINETTGSESSDSYVVPFVIPCEITSYLYKQAADLVISKDNGDVERKFIKDPLDVDSSDMWLGTQTGFAWTGSMLSWDGPTRANIFRSDSGSIQDKKIECEVRPDSIDSVGYIGVVVGDTASDEGYRIAVRCPATGVRKLYIHKNYGGAIVGTSSADIPEADFAIGTWYYMTVTITTAGVITATIICNGVTYTATGTDTTVTERYCGVQGDGVINNCSFRNFTVSPSISYADDFTTDTVSGATGRYRAGYPNTYETDCLRLVCGNYNTTALRSYLFGSGEFAATVKALPAAAPVGARVGIIPHGQNLTTQTGGGFTVGVIKTATGWAAGWGNGKSLTSLGTDVPHLVDGDSVVIDVDSDQEHGVAYAYIYKVGNYRSHPDCVAFKFYHTVTTEGQFGLWAYYDGGGYFEISNITIRAESIVGRTNVEVTEPFWFRDEFDENSIGRYAGNTSDMSVSGGKLLCSTCPRHIAVASAKLQNQTVSFTWKPTSVDGSNKYRAAVGFRTDGNSIYDLYSSLSTDLRYIVYFIGDQSKVVLYKGSTSIGMLQEIACPVTYDAEHEITVTKTGKVFEVDVDGTTYTLTDPAWTPEIESTFTTLQVHNCGATPHEIDNLQISGTRVYQKSIHRGAMLGLYSTS